MFQGRYLVTSARKLQTLSVARFALTPASTDALGGVCRVKSVIFDFTYIGKIQAYILEEKYSKKLANSPPLLFGQCPHLQNSAIHRSKAE